MRRILIHEEACIGCGLCTVHCTVQHSQSKDIVKAYKRERPRPLSRVYVDIARPISAAIQCRHCDDPPCVSACLSGALQIAEDQNMVHHDSEKCMGCWTCIMVCPYGAVMMDTHHNIVAKCDLCLDLETPSCVANCPNAALAVIEVQP